jgi:hypothetical protein
MASAQALPAEQTKSLSSKKDEIPRIDLEKLDNVPYYIESELDSIKFDI